MSRWLETLSPSICAGAVELEKLTLRRDALRKLKLPVEVKSGIYEEGWGTTVPCIFLLPFVFSANGMLRSDAWYGNMKACDK